MNVLMSCDNMYSNAGNYKCRSKLQYFQKKMKVISRKVGNYSRQSVSLDLGLKPGVRPLGHRFWLVCKENPGKL
ncbi:hypothetical protein SAMN05216311_104149 [Chitinophaga sp. CF418]|nr:hypothetical protein SAMN05216311_104149 [Chitinophaga sp. CF418]